MWRIGESRMGSYTGRMAPPGSPKMTSTPSSSRALISACPPLSFMFDSLGWFGLVDARKGQKRERPPGWEVVAPGRVRTRVLVEYYYEGCAVGHEWAKYALRARRIPTEIRQIRK